MELTKVIVILSFLVFNNVIHVNSSESFPPDTDIHNPSLPVFKWIDHAMIEVEFPDETRDLILLRPPNKIAGVQVRCLHEGTIKGEPSSDVVVSGCKNDHLVYITIHSERLLGRSMFHVQNGTTEEIVNPYANGEPENELYDYEEDINQRVKRTVIEDYVIEEYDEYASDGNVDPPPNLNLNVKIGYEESLKRHLGNETAAHNYVVEVFTHGRSYMRHSSLGTSLTLTLVEEPTYVANKTWTARRASLAEAKTFKTNESVPIIYFCYDGEEESYLGISQIRGACDSKKGVAIMKYRQSIPLAANTYVHEKGHLTGLWHDKREDEKNLGGEICHGGGVMSEIPPGERPMKFTSCNSRRFKSWFNAYGTCLTEIDVPVDLKTCPYPSPSDISPCICKADNVQNYLYCSSMDQNLTKNLAARFRCANKLHKLDVNLHRGELDYNLTDICDFELEYVNIHNVSKVTTDIDTNAFSGSRKSLREIKIQRLPGKENAKQTIRTGTFSNLVALKNIQLGPDFQTLQTKAFSGLPSMVKLNLESITTIETKAFHNMSSLKLLDLTQSHVKTIATESFFDLPSLITIMFNAGTITTLQTKAFSELPSLSTIDLSGHKLLTIPTNSFYNLPSLASANLSHSQIRNISSNIFSNVPRLTLLDLSNNLITFLPAKAFENIPTLSKLYLSNNKISSIDSNAMSNIPLLTSLDLNKNYLQDVGNFLENLQCKDLVITLRDNKMKLLPEDSFKPYIAFIMDRRGYGYIDIGRNPLQCGCDTMWLMSQQNIAGIAKFRNATCQDGDTLAQVDGNFLERWCPSKSCLAPVGIWELGGNINPCDGGNFGYVGPWSQGVNVGSPGQAFTKDFINIDIWKKPAGFVTIARHVDGQCTMSKTWELKDKTRSLYSYFSTYPGRIYATGDGSRSDNHIASDIPQSAEGLTGTWRDPIFGAEGGLVFNWCYSNNGARIAVPGGYKIPYSLPGLNEGGEDLHGLGNEYYADTATGQSQGQHYWYDVGKIGPDCQSSTCQLVGTDQGSSLKRTPGDKACWGSYAIFVSQDAKSFNCQGRTLTTVERE